VWSEGGNPYLSEHKGIFFNWLSQTDENLKYKIVMMFIEYKRFTTNTAGKPFPLGMG